MVVATSLYQKKRYIVYIAHTIYNIHSSNSLAVLYQRESASIFRIYALIHTQSVHYKSGQNIYFRVRSESVYIFRVVCAAALAPSEALLSRAA